MTFFSVISGGTIDIVVHKITEDGTLAEVYKASGGDWGGTIVTKNLRRLSLDYLRMSNVLISYGS